MSCLQTLKICYSERQKWQYNIFLQGSLQYPGQIDQLLLLNEKCHRKFLQGNSHECRRTSNVGGCKLSAGNIK